MVTTLTLPALAFLMAISGIPGLNALPWLKSFVRHRPHAAVADTLPPRWKSASLLALDTLFVKPGLPAFGRHPGMIQLGAGSDPRLLRNTVDPDSAMFRSSVAVGDVLVGNPFRRPLADFGSITMRESFAAKWQEMSRQKVGTGAGGIVSSRTGLSLALPVALPKVVTSILGPGGPALNVSGSESIRLSGTSDWTNQNVGILGVRRSLFPSLDMQQDLNIQLEGQLSDRVKVNLLQNSANQVPLSNLIAINYKGEEDDLVQELALGNTSLSLPGTQYVSYSGRNEGLIGVKLATRLGPLDFTALASKQEGKSERASYTGGASLASHILADLDYDKGRYFLLYDPQYTLLKIEDTDIHIYRDDGNYGNDDVFTSALAMVDPGSKTGVPRFGDARDSSAFRGHFDLLYPGVDYDILPDYYVLQGGVSFKIIRLKQPIPQGSEMCLAATYKGTPVADNGAPSGAPQVEVGGTAPADSLHPGELEFKMLRPPHKLLSSVDPSNSNATFDPANPFDAVRELEMKNFYQLPGFQIDPQGFKLAIQRGSDQPPITYVPQANGPSIGLLEVLGLDNFDETQTTRVPGHDEKVDGSAYQSGARLFINFADGTLWFPDPRPFAPRITPGNKRLFDDYMNRVLNRRLTLTAGGDSVNSPNDFYDLYNPIPSQVTRFYITTTFAAQRGGGDITLGRGNILAGSDVVTVNGERWTRDRDYTIDYDLGHVTLKRNLGATDQLNIDYSYAPLFAQASKTLLGSAFRVEGRGRSVGGAFLYESQGAQDLRPRLGEEPSRTLITDLNTDWTFKPDFVTRAIDRLPGVHTTTPSDFNFQAELGASFPNPNTKNQVYIDDMEGVRDAVSLSLSPERWQLMSVPSRFTNAAGDTLAAPIKLTDLNSPLDPLGSNLRQWNAELHWYYPYNTVKEKDLKPNLSAAQGGDNVHQVLALSVPRFPTSPPVGVTADSLWAGLTYQLDDRGIDVSRSQFIEVWVNDFNNVTMVRDKHVRLHLDLGVVSEDMMRAPNRLPNKLLESEDQRPRDHQLTVTPGHDEDTGYDGLDDEAERSLYAGGTNSSYPLADLTTASASDPEGDDWQTITKDFHDIDPRHWLYTNGTEGNKSQFPYPNTEDMNLNDNLDEDERFFEYTIDLGQTLASGPYLVDDIANQYAGNPNVKPDNGWRRYRIPLGDKLRQIYGSPDLTVARHVRVWVSGLRDHDVDAVTEIRPILELGGIEIVGSRWLSTDLTPEQVNQDHTTLTLNSVNSVDNAEIYTAPFDPGETLNGSQALKRREQSLSLEFTNLADSSAIEAYRTFSIDEDYSRYGALTWYVAAYGIQGYDASVDTYLNYFVRFGSDERGDNYYELRRRLPANSSPRNIHWDQIHIDLHAMAGVKLDPQFPKSGDILYSVPFGPDGDQLIIKGRPSLTRLRRISFGLVNLSPDSSRVFPSGQLWMDEMRAIDVAKDVGLADRVLVNGHLANLASYNVAWNSRDADFLSVGETRGSGTRQTNLSVTSTMNPERFFEGTGIALPVSVVYNDNVSKPRFTAGDDVVRTGAQQEASQTRTISRSLSTSYSRNWSERSNPLLRYSIGGLTANASRSQSDNVSPTGRSQSEYDAAAVAWGISPRRLLAIGLPGTKAKFYPLPDRIYSNYTWAQTQASTFTRAADDPTRLIPSSATNGQTAGLSMGIDTRPFELIQHHFDATRSLSLTGLERTDRVLGLDLGRTTSWRQNFNAHWTAAAGPWLQPNFSWNSNFSTAADLQSKDLSVHNANNGQTVQMNWTLPFDQLGLRSAARRPQPIAPPPAAGDSTRHKPATKPRPNLNWREWLARVGNVQTDMSINKSSSFSRLLGMPSFLYTVGLVDDPGLSEGHRRVDLDPANSTSTGTDWRANARTRVLLAFGSAVSTRFSIGDRTSATNGVATRTTDARFPDLDVDYGKLADVIHLTRLMQTPSIRTSWVHSVSADYRGTTSTRTGKSSSNDFHPLLAMRGSLKNGTTADLSINSRNTIREVSQFGTSTTTDNNMDMNFTVSRSYSAGQKINFLGKTKTVRSSGSLQLATVYSHHTGQTIVPNSTSATRPVNDTRMSMTGTGNYGFSSNVTGSAVLGFTQSHDNTLDNLRRSVRVEVRAQFTF